MKYIKKYLRLILGIVMLILGIAFMIVPFIPIGYIFIFVAAFFLATYIPPLHRLLNYLKKRDKKGRLEKVEHKVEDFEEKLGGNKNEDEKQESSKKEHKEKREPLDIKVEKVSNKKKERDTDDRKH